MTTVAVLGSTGSIGTQTLDVVRAESGRYEVVALGASRSVDLIAEQAKEFRPKPSRLCGWCAHQALCPAFGGTPPPFPDPPAPRPADALAAAGMVEPPGADEE